MKIEEHLKAFGDFLGIRVFFLSFFFCEIVNMGETSKGELKDFPPDFRGVSVKLEKINGIVV